MGSGAKSSSLIFYFSALAFAFFSASISALVLYYLGLVSLPVICCISAYESQTLAEPAI
jgi:hypothetical protein